jgi:CBS-domain-containing membrane protein
MEGPMRVQELMQKDVKACKATENANAAAKLMWDHGCGTLPVLDKDEKVIGMITDRDICMAAYTQGKRLADIAVASCMSKTVFASKPTDDLGAAETLMEKNGIRRIPVVNDQGALVGIVSLDDLARRINGGKAEPHVTEKEVARTFAGICSRKPVAAKAE